MISAYEGKEPYIFVSYSHKDKEAVYHVMELLAARGYRIWYDQGIEPGSDWPEDIAQHLMKAEVVLAFITANAMESVNCKNEISFAVAKSKPFLSVIMEKTKMPAGVQLQISSQQSVIRYQMSSEKEFIDRICECPYMKPCKGEPRNIPVSKVHRKRNRDYEIILAVSLAVLLLVIVFAVKGCVSEAKPEQIPEETQVTETAVPTETAAPEKSEQTEVIAEEPTAETEAAPEPQETAVSEPTATPETESTPEPTAEPAETATPAVTDSQEPTETSVTEPEETPSAEDPAQPTEPVIESGEQSGQQDDNTGSTNPGN